MNSKQAALICNSLYYSGENSVTSISAPSVALYHEKYLWLILEKLSGLPLLILRRISWIKGHQNEASKSIFFKNRYGILAEVYRAMTWQEAQDLLNFLQKIGSDYDYFIGDSENIDLDWIIIRNGLGEAAQVVGRYPLRSSAEDVARVMSIKDEAVYQVKAEEISDLKGSIFFKGQLAQNML